MAEWDAGILNPIARFTKKLLDGVNPFGFLLGVLIIFCVYRFFVKPMPPVPRIHGKTILITGGSQGVGLSVVKECCKFNAKKIIVVARDAAKLEKIKPYLTTHNVLRPTTALVTVSCDISSLESVAAALTEDLLKTVDTVFHCAGVAVARELEELELTDVKKMIDTNLTGTILVQKLLWRFFKSRKCGCSVFFSSQGGQIGIYGYSAYAASKFGLKGFVESLRQEATYLARRSGKTGEAMGDFQNVLVFPPSVDTPGYHAENVGKPAICKNIEGTSGLLTPDEVAEKVVEAVELGRETVTFGFVGTLLNSLTTGFMCPTSGTELVSNLLWLPVSTVLSIGMNLYWNKFVLS